MLLRIVAILILLLPGLLSAQDTQPEAGDYSIESPVPNDNSQKPKIKILPNGYYRPETKIAVGIFALLTFKVHRKDTLTRASFIKSTFVITQNKQLALENDWLVFFKKEKISFYGSLDFMKFPENFYGIGNNTNKDSVRNYELNRITHNSLVLKKIKGNYFAGLNFDTQYLYGDGPTQGLDIYPLYANVRGANGYFVNGLGPTFLVDSRDNGLMSHKGWYSEASINFHGTATLSEYNFTNVILNSRKFIPVRKTSIWASEVYFNFNTGDLPFRSNPFIGGARFLRGYYTGRFRDKDLIFCQTEIRIPVVWKIGVVFFAGMGEVAPDFKSFSIPGMKYSAGGGLRFLISKKENANLRLDYGFTKEGGGLYMVFGESF
jgi:hypothetical protein